MGITLFTSKNGSCVELINTPWYGRLNVQCGMAHRVDQQRQRKSGLGGVRA